MKRKSLIEKLGDSVGVYKIGLELLFSGGFDLARDLARQGRSVFVDAKLLDIEATVERATAVIAESGAAFLTVHAHGPQDARRRRARTGRQRSSSSSA